MAFDIFENFATDEKLEVHGAWHDLSPGSRIKVARIDNPVYQAALAEGMQENAEKIKTPENATEEQQEEARDEIRKVMAKAASKGLLRDFEGLSYQKKPIKYTPANAEKLLQHKDFLELVLQLANNVSRFRIKAEEEEQKNS